MAQYSQAAALAPEGSALSVANLAWLLATSSDASIRDGAKAVELAQQAVSLSGGKEPLFFRTLAAAYAETGRFSNAIAVIQQGVALARVQGKPVWRIFSKETFCSIASRFRFDEHLPAINSQGCYGSRQRAGHMKSSRFLWYGKPRS